jgi:hypothetical protein
MKLRVKEIDEDTVNNALHQTRSVVLGAITTMDINGNRLSFWPLFLTEKSGYSPSDIDTCATSIGTMALLELTENDCLPQTLTILENACKTILFMRNKDGSWPSIILLSTKQPPKMEGVLNDTTYALESLIKLGFLNRDPEVPIEMDLDTRIDLVVESVKWLLDNRVGNGWDYTGIEYLESIEGVSPAILPTSNVITILYTVMTVLETLRKSPPELSEIKDAYKEAVVWLRDIQSEKGEFGKKKGDRPTIVHTAIAINALLTDGDDDETKKSILKGIKYILENKKAFSVEKLEYEDMFDEYDQIIFIEEKTIRRRVIKHENFLEGILLNVLIKTDEKGYIDKLNFVERYRFRKIIKYLLNELLKGQKKSGILQGAFRSRRSAPAEKYPIYFLYFATLGLKSLRKNLKNILKKPSLKTLIEWGIGMFMIILLTTWLISWVLNLSLEKAVGVFIFETVIGLIGPLFKQRF